MSALSDGPPYQDPFEEVDDQGKPTGYFARSWLNFWSHLQTLGLAAPRRLKRVTVPVNAVIGTTPFALGSLSAGLYEVKWNARVKTPAGVSGNFQITLGYTDGGVAQTFVGDNLNGNLTTTKESQSKMLRIDKGAPITYAVAYNSNPAAVLIGVIDFIINELG